MKLLNFVDYIDQENSCHLGHWWLEQMVFPKIVDKDTARILPDKEETIRLAEPKDRDQDSEDCRTNKNNHKLPQE